MIGQRPERPKPVIKRMFLATVSFRWFALRLRRSAADAALALQKRQRRGQARSGLGNQRSARVKAVVTPPFQTDQMYFTQRISATFSKVLVLDAFCGCAQRLLLAVVVVAAFVPVQG